jgi:hypothetical protein
MKLFISISFHADPYFSERALEVAYRQNTMSRETVIHLTPEQFLKLARPGHDEIKEKRVKALLAQGEKFNEVPLLGPETNKDGDLIIEEGSYHEGRHRVRALKEVGATQIPVRILSREGGEGSAYRWGQTERRPKKLIGYNNYTIDFPKTETY